MKIAYINHKGDTVGGFPQHTELSIKGLKELGHEVEFIYLDYFDSFRTDIASKLEDNCESISWGAGTGLPFHPEYGWVVEPTSYKGHENRCKIKSHLETFDAVFWHTPFWFKQKKTLKDTGWIEIMDLKNPIKIGMVHDANLRGNSAWQFFISKYFDKIINVHQASYNSSKVLPVERTLIFNPQDLSKVSYNKNNFKNIKETGFLFSIQNWKPSKRVADLIRAIPYLDKSVKVNIAGGGIEKRYIFGSIEKMKSEYYSKAKDINYAGSEKTIGETALDSGNLFLNGWLNEKNRDEMYSKTAFFIDTAWYKVNLEIGEHFSRVLIESMMNGIVPIARDLGLSNNYKGIGELFKSGENYIMIPHNATPEEFASIVNKSYKMSEKEYAKIVENNYKLLSLFDYKNIAKQYEMTIKGNPTGFYNKYEKGTPPIDFIKKAESQWFGSGEKRTFNFKVDETYLKYKESFSSQASLF